MSAPASGGVVVGVSPTTGSPQALRWAAGEARLRAAPLRAVMAWRPPRPPAVAGTRPPAGLTQAGTDAAAEAEQALREFVAQALGADSLTPPAAGGVHCEVVRGSAVTALLTSARDAQLLVIGEPRAGRVSNVRTTLVAPQVMLRANCPVVAMPRAVGTA
ncbi:universal stress protein [uncultured Jatrophihabitans sp.]|uniref:universal stress protein n=1 Tax=uncultured Jatrophihabitans sp. TaxID=1610747 RepID=UPI0035CB4184